jgi:cytochrome b subunit of formate dehydrogenase
MSDPPNTPAADRAVAPETSASPAGGETTRYFVRFDRTDRALHGLLMVSFFGLALTGLPLLFSDEGWARLLARALGGLPAMGLLHRSFATLLIATFLAHLARLARHLITERDWGLLWGPRSMVPQPRDFVEFAQHVRWFLGRGPRPAFDRYTYWEKFDYWAVFWGMAIIGGSGLLLWFPEWFGRVLPGWVFNVALLVHGEEALLAVGFIFTIHFFNTHLRPEKFPTDTVIFTGRLSEAELAAERPAEYERLQREGRLEARATDPPPTWLTLLARFVAAVAVTVGLVMLALIVYGVLR